MLRRAVFLDRDGVLNRAIVRDGKPYPPASLAELDITEEAIDACTLLRGQGFALVCITNQPDIARGTACRDDIDAMNARVQQTLQLDRVLVCPHDDATECQCRKPRPGLLLAAAQDLGIALDASVMIGDRWRDVEAGRAAGCRTVFIDRNYREKRPAAPDYTTPSLREAAHWVLALSLL